jgi:hypothetical protein
LHSPMLQEKTGIANKFSNIAEQLCRRKGTRRIRQRRRSATLPPMDEHYGATNSQAGRTKNAVRRGPNLCVVPFDGIPLLTLRRGTQMRCDT